MNKEYTCVDDKVLVKVESGYNKVVPYQDNIEEVLISENIIEELEKKKKEIYDDREYWEKRNSRPKLLKILYNICPIMVGVVSPLLVVHFLKLIDSTSYALMLTERISAMMMVFAPIPTTAMTIGMFLEDKYADKQERALNTQIHMLNEAINKEKTHLTKLKENNTSFITRNIDTNTIDYNAIKDNIDNYCNLYYDCSYNLENYYNYYLEHGQLPNKVQRNYNLESQKLFREYVEEKGPVLIKTTNNKRK